LHWLPGIGLGAQDMVLVQKTYQLFSSEIIDEIIAYILLDVEIKIFRTGFLIIIFVGIR
jgi:hypothetical protein